MAPVAPPAHVSCVCFQRAQAVLATLGIDAKYLNSATDRCFCSDCFDAREEVFICGNPPAQCVHPIGWVRFGVKVTEAHVDDNSYVAYHGTKAWLVPKILANKGQLMFPGLVSIEGREIEVPKGHYKDGDYLLAPQGACSSVGRLKHCLVLRDLDAALAEQEALLERPLSNADKDAMKAVLTESERVDYPGAVVYQPNRRLFTTPSVRYASLPVYSPWWDDGHGGQFQVVLQVLQTPGSFVVLHETVGLTQQGIQLDAHFANDELEWFTDILTSITITGILIKVSQRPGLDARPATGPAAHDLDAPSHASSVSEAFNELDVEDINDKL